MNDKPLTQHEKWKDGDFEVIANDNVLFKVPTYFLQAASHAKFAFLSCSLPGQFSAT